MLLLAFASTSLYAQVGINTTTPTAKLDVNGNLRIRTIPNGVSSDSILVVNNGFVRKIAISALSAVNQGTCPMFVKGQSNGYYLLFKSTGAINNPANPLTINTINFTNAGNWIQGNLYYFSWTNTTGQPLNINNFSVNFNGQTCNYQ